MFTLRQTLINICIIIFEGIRGILLLMNKMNNKKQKFLSKCITAKCGYCGLGVLEQNLSRHCIGKHKREKLAAGDTQITSYFGQKRKQPTPDFVKKNSDHFISTSLTCLLLPPSHTLIPISIVRNLMKFLVA